MRVAGPRADGVLAVRRCLSRCLSRAAAVAAELPFGPLVRDPHPREHSRIPRVPSPLAAVTHSARLPEASPASFGNCNSPSLPLPRKLFTTITCADVPSTAMAVRYVLSSLRPRMVQSAMRTTELPATSDAARPGVDDLAAGHVDVAGSRGSPRSRAAPPALRACAAGAGR